MAAAYADGATVYELAAKFRCTRQTVALRLKHLGMQMHNQPATYEQVAQFVTLYGSGLSLVRVGAKTGFSSKTVLNYLRAEGLPLRDTHGRTKG